MNTELQSKLRDLRNGLYPDIETVNAVLDECIKLEGEQTEGEPVIQTQDMLTRGEARQLIRNMRARCQAGQCDHASAIRNEAAAHPPQPSGLSDRCVETIIDEIIMAEGDMDQLRARLKALTKP